MASRISDREAERFSLQLAMLEGAKDGGHDERLVLEQLEGQSPGFGDFYRRLVQDKRDRVELIDFGGATVRRGPEKRPSWYSGARRNGEWANYREVLEGKLPSTAVTSIGDSTESITADLADPRKPHDKHKGLVVGYVQSGKTANYAGVISKAIDQGYRIIIVLSGMHSNLRRQTQERLTADLRTQTLRAIKRPRLSFVPLTTADADIADLESHIGFLNSKDNVLIGVVKKNVTRLDRVAAFLRAVNEEDPHMLIERPVLIIDDESDQATPNSSKAGAKISAINRAIRGIWKEVRTGTYVAYTATPFANIFINPHDREDLYPEDFVTTLPRPEGYMGAAEFFGSLSEDAGEGMDGSTRFARLVCPQSTDVLTPQGRDLDSYSPQMVPELRRALHWFLIATAVKRLRGMGSSHSSMLVHTSHRVRAHELLADVLESYLSELFDDPDAVEAQMQEVFGQEIDSASDLRGGKPRPEWPSVWAEIRSMLEKRGVIVRTDNAASKDRLEYPADDPQTVIAVGGGTLSRGLTLEGLVVSFFLRTSNAYDTLLQMGRWFGFRHGYADLVRVWVAPGLIEDYAFLARVEEDLRSEIKRMDEDGLTPRHVGLKVLLHPGRLQITAGNKMRAAKLVDAQNGGQRYQSTYLDRSPRGLAQGHDAAKTLVAEALLGNAEVIHGRGAHLLRGVSSIPVLKFLTEAWIPDVYPWMQADAVQAWLAKNAPDATWNILLMSPGGTARPRFTFAEGFDVRTASRTPLNSSQWTPTRYEGKLPYGSDVVNIRALLTEGDQFEDIRLLGSEHWVHDAESHDLATSIISGTFSGDPAAIRQARHRLVPGEGTIILYAIDKDSAPKPGTEETRDPMQAQEHLVGIGLVYPSASEPDQEQQRKAVDPASAFIEFTDEEEEDLPLDNEGDYTPPMEETRR